MENLKKKIQEVINLYKSQKFSEAELFSKNLLKMNPKVFFLYNILGLTLIAQGKNDEAIMYYKKGISIKPDYAMIYDNLATAYKLKKNYVKAENYYKKSVKLDSKLPETQNNLASLYVDLNKYAEAITSFKKAIKINSDFYVAHYNLGVLYKNIGNFEESKKSLNESIRLYPQFYNSHRALSQINKYKVDDKHIDIMMKLYKENNINISGKIELSFALGKAFDDINNFEEAFKYYNVGNKLCRNNIKFSLKKENEEFQNIKETFNKSFFNKYRKVGNKNSSVIFIIGMPRSGTTLVEQIISSHPKVFGGDELDYFNDFIEDSFYKNGNFSIQYDTNYKDINFKKIGHEYVNKIKEISGKSERVTDKLPINFKWIGFIKLILPNSKIIHCVRNPKDTCLSIYKNCFTNTKLNYAYDFDELVNFYNLYNNLMKFWKEILPGFIAEIKYEDLIKNPKKEIPKLIKNCNLSWSKKCLRFYDNKRAVRTASDVQVRNKMYATSIDSWKNYEKYFKRNFAKLDIN